MVPGAHTTRKVKQQRGESPAVWKRSARRHERLDRTGAGHQSRKYVEASSASGRHLRCVRSFGHQRMVIHPSHGPAEGAPCVRLSFASAVVDLDLDLDFNSRDEMLCRMLLAARGFTYWFDRAGADAAHGKHWRQDHCSHGLQGHRKDTRSHVSACLMLLPPPPTLLLLTLPIHKAYIKGLRRRQHSYGC